MTTSEPLQPTLFPTGSEEIALPYWPTPRATMGALHQPSADKERQGGGKPKRLEVEVGKGRSISSPLATPANPSVRPGSDWARRMTVISGRRLPGWSRISGPVGACLKTLLGTSVWGSTTCYLTWKASATPGGRLLYRLVPSMPRTGATGFGLWPDLWPTPTLNGNHNRAGLSEKSGDGLATAVKQRTNTGLFTTPTADDTGARTSSYAQGGTALSAQVGGKLSAAWVTKLMGYPPGWVDVD